MILDRLTLEGFRLHRRTDVTFGLGLTAVVGANGSGKSTLLEAVTFVLYGEQRGTKEGLRADDGAPFRARLEFRLGGAAYTVERRPDRAFLARQGADGGEKRLAEGLSDTTRACARLLGLSYEQFRNSFLAEQKGLAFLRFRTATARQEEVGRMLGLDRLQRAERAAGEARRAAGGEAKALEGTVGDEAAIRATFREAEEAVRVAKGEMRAVRSEAKRAEDEATKAAPEGRAAEAYLALVARSAAAQEALRRAQATLAVAREAAGIAEREAAEASSLVPDAARHASLSAGRPAAVRADAARREAESLDPRGTATVETASVELDAARAAWRTRREGAVAEGAAARESLAAARRALAEAETGAAGAPCPVCGRPLGLEASAWRAELATRVVAAEARAASVAVPTEPPEIAILAQRLRAAELRAVVGPDLAALDAELAALAPVAARAKALAGSDRRLADAGRRVQDAQKDERRAGEAAHATRAALEATGLADEGAARAALARAAAARAAAEGAATALRAAEAVQTNAERALVVADERLQEARGRREALRAARHAEALHGAVATEMRALRAALNGALRPDLEARAGELLERMTAGRYRRARLSADFEPTLVDEENDRTVLSGGEEDVVALALRLALAELVQDRQGHALTLLMLDEAFGALDAERRQSLLDVLVGLRERYAQVIVVTHIEDVAQVADRVLRVSRDDTGAARVAEA